MPYNPPTLNVETLPTQIQTRLSNSGSNRAHMERLVADLRARLEQARQGGDERSVRRHREQGKLLVRERIERLLDRESPFLELSPLAATGVYDDDAPGAGLVTGIGRVSSAARC